MSNTVTKLRAMLGNDVVLLAIRAGEKKPILAGWQKITTAEMGAAYLDGLNHGGNIGVSLGKPSNGLCTIDIDDDASVEPFLALNPKLRDTLRTTRARGCNLWLRIRGPFPALSKIKTTDGKDFGEWRATGGQTVIHGSAIDKKKGETTPTSYRILAGERPVEIEFSEIIWNENLVLPWSKTEEHPPEPPGKDLSALIKKHGEPFYLNEKKQPSELNEGFWAGLHASENHLVWEPSEREFYTYDQKEGIYAPTTTDAIKLELSERLLKASRQTRQFWLQTQRSDRKLGAIAMQLRGLVEQRNAFEKQGAMVALGNGILNLTGEGEFHEFTPQIRARNKSPIPYAKDAECPRFLDELILPAVHAEDAVLIQKYAGLCLLGENRIQRMLILDGLAGRGKTQLANVVQSVVGRANVTQLRTKFLGERFETFKFLRKTLLVGIDVDPDFLSTRGASVLKGLVGGDWFDCEQKGGTGSFPMQGNFCAIVTSNSRLRVRLQGDVGAWHRRLLIVRYEAPPPKRKIPFFAEALVKEEGAGILRWCLAGLRLLLDDIEDTGDIAQSDRQKQVVDSLLAESDSLRVFLTERLTKTASGDVSVQEIVESYAAFCPERGWRALPITEIQDSLDGLMLDLISVTKSHSVKREGKSVRGFRGVALC